MKRDRQFCKFFALIAPSTQGEVAVEGKNIDFIFGKMQIFVGAHSVTGATLCHFRLKKLQQNGRQHLQLTPAKFCRN